MTDIIHTNNILNVTNFQDLVSTPFQGETNAICWKRELEGDFSEIVHKLDPNENLLLIEDEDLLNLDLSELGKIARDHILKDLNVLRELGAAPVLNLIKHYARDETFPLFPTDVYSFHVDRSPVPVSTYLCTYYGAPSELVSNAQAEQKVMVPEIRETLKARFKGDEQDFKAFLINNFFDLHYRVKPDATIISMGKGHLWRLAVDHPESKVLPCIHRAPKEKNDEPRLLLIC